MTKFKIQYVFKFEVDFGSDEAAVRIFIDDKEVAQYGDYYHDKGSFKAEGFLDGYCYAMGIKLSDCKYETEEIADPTVY